MTNLTSLTFGESTPCDHVMVDLLSSALKTLQQAHLLAGVFPSKVAQVIITCVVKLFGDGALVFARGCSGIIGHCTKTSHTH